MNQLELRVQQHPGTIELNFEELNTALDAKLAEYKGVEYRAKWYGETEEEAAQKVSKRLTCQIRKRSDSI